jgi:hypothetical protein
MFITLFSLNLCYDFNGDVVKRVYDALFFR